jgi:hypothetical protein
MKSDSSGRVFVVATHERFMYECRARGLDPRGGQAVHVTRQEDVRGHSLGPEDEIVDGGTWDSAPLIAALEACREPS